MKKSVNQPQTPPETSSYRESSANLSNSQAAKDFASHVIANTAPEEEIDALALLDQFPQLRPYKSAVLDLAYEQFCRQIESGESPDPHQFAARFPQYERSLRRLLEVHQHLEQNFPYTDSEPPKWPHVGDSFLGFQLIEELGRGAFSRVFLANEQALGDRSVVLKVCTYGKHEAQTLGRLRHRNIVPVHSVQHDANSNLTAICMPYQGRVTLFDLLDHAFIDGNQPGRFAKTYRHLFPSKSDEGRLSRLARMSHIDAVVCLARQLADALHYTHQAGYLHCDIKPSNVLVTTEGEARLFDFNLAFAEQARTGEVGGTIPYMSPEQLITAAGASSNSVPLDGRSDIFSLGVLLYELLSGNHPFGKIPAHLPTRKLAKELLDRQRSGPRPLRKRNNRINHSLASLVIQCLQYAPEQRPASAGELSKRLAEQLYLSRRSGRLYLRHRRLAIASGLAIMTAGGSAIVAWLNREPAAERHFRIGGQAFRNGDYDNAIDHFTQAMDSGADPVNVRFARGRALQHRGQFDLALNDFQWVRQATKGDPRAVSCLAYCLANRAQQEKNMTDIGNSLALFEFAVKDERFAPALLKYNIAWCYMRLTRRDRHFQTTLKWVSEALKQDPHLQAGYHLLAVIDRKLAVRGSNSPDLNNIQKALDLGSCNASLHLEAACIFALAASRNQEDLASQTIENALKNCWKAVRKGLPPTQLQMVASYNQVLADDPRFQEILNYKPEHQHPAILYSIPPLIDPLLGINEPLALR